MINKYLNKIITLGLVIGSIAIVNPMLVNADTKTYGIKDGNRYRDINNHQLKFLKDDGTYARNEWIHEYKSNNTIGNYDVWNYFGDDCINKEGWFQVDGKWYYGDQYHDDDFYGIYINEWAPSYFNKLIDSNNKEHINIGNYDYFCGADGAMKTGWFQAHPYKYDSSGDMLHWFYAGPDGKILRNTYTPDGYWVNSNGSWK